jgi:hypothetical protein
MLTLSLGRISRRMLPMLVFTTTLAMLVAANVVARILRDHGTYPDLPQPPCGT